MRKKLLEKRMTRLTERKAALKARAQASEDVAEVRAIQEQIEAIDEDIADIQEELDAIAKEERSAVPANAQTHGAAAVRAAFGQNTAEERDADPYGTLEYRQAFMRFVQTGAETEGLIQRDGSPANTETISATIPTTVMNELINEVRERYGNLYAKVRKLNVQGGVKFPIASLQASAKWINETTVSPRQDGGEVKDYVVFGYNVLELRIAQTLLSSVVALDVFEREIATLLTEAFVKAMDYAIVRGSGDGAPLGILNDPRVTGQTGHTITMTAANMSDWKAWRKNFFAKLPLGYRSGEFIFSLGTVDAYLETMSDDNNNPIFSQATGLVVNDGDAANPNGRFYGREISLVEPDIVPDFDTAQAGDVVGIFWQPLEYAVNSNMAFQTRRWFDEDRNEWVNKMLAITDGKTLNPKGFYLIVKG